MLLADETARPIFSNSGRDASTKTMEHAVLHSIKLARHSASPTDKAATTTERRFHSQADTKAPLALVVGVAAVERLLLEPEDDSEGLLPDRRELDAPANCTSPGGGALEKTGDVPEMPLRGAIRFRLLGDDDISSFDDEPPRLLR